MRTLIILLTAFWFAGCSLTREVPPEQGYQLHLDAPEAKEAACADRVLRVALLQAPQWLQGTAIYYAADGGRLYRYTRARWEQPPVFQLQQITEKCIIESGLFEAVVPYKSQAKNDWLLEIRIERMLQRIDAAGAGETELMLYGVLVDQYSRIVMAQKTFRYASSSEKANVQTAMDAWNRAAASYRDDLLNWLQQQCNDQPKEDRSDVDLR